MVAHGRGGLATVALAGEASQAASRFTRGTIFAMRRFHRILPFVRSASTMHAKRYLAAAIISGSLAAISACSTGSAPPPVVVPPAEFVALGRHRAISVGRAGRRGTFARGQVARRQDQADRRLCGAVLYGRARQRASAPDGRHRPRRASRRRRHRHPHSRGPDLRYRKRGGETAVRRHAAGDCANGEDAQPNLCRRLRPHRHQRDAADQPNAVGQARGGRRRPISPRMAWPRRGWRRADWAKARRSTIPTTRRPSRPPTAASRSAWRRSAASAVRRRSRAGARRSPPRQCRRARRAGDDRSAARKCARRGRRRHPWGPRRRSAVP